MGKSIKFALFVLFATSLVIATAQERGTAGEDFTWKLSDLKVTMGSESVQGEAKLDTKKKYAGRPTLWVKLYAGDKKAGGKELGDVFLRMVYEAKEFETSNEVCMLRRQGKEGVSQLQFKSKEIAKTIGDNRKVSIKAQLVLASEKNGKWVLESKLTNPVAGELAMEKAGQ